MRNGENKYILRGKHLITNLLLVATNSSFVKGSKKTQKNTFLFLTNN